MALSLVALNTLPDGSCMLLKQTLAFSLSHLSRSLSLFPPPVRLTFCPHLQQYAPPAHNT